MTVLRQRARRDTCGDASLTLRPANCVEVLGARRESGCRPAAGLPVGPPMIGSLESAAAAEGHESLTRLAGVAGRPALVSMERPARSADAWIIHD